jgi:hypothetical protein
MAPVDRLAHRYRAGVPAATIGLAIVVSSVSTGCGSVAETGPVAAPGCAATVREASLAADVEQQIASLDLALARCPSIEALIGEMKRYPGIVGFSPETFVEVRCETAPTDAVLTSPTCTSFAAPATVAIQVVPDAAYAAQTLDGRAIEIAPDADTPFVDGRPEAIQRAIDVAIESGCEGVIAVRNEWAARVADPVIGDEASAYARHAEDVARYIRCVFEPLLPAPSPAPAPSTSAPVDE